MLQLIRFILAGLFGFIERHRARILWLFLVIVTCGLLYAQTDPGTPPVVIPSTMYLIYFGALFLGMFVHWLVGYIRGKIATNLIDYLVSSIGQTFAAIIAAVGSLIALMQTSPQNFVAFSIFSAWTVFLSGYGFDSALNGDSSFIKGQLQSKAGSSN